MIKENISIVIPIYNEEKSLEELLMKIKQVFSTLNYEYEIIGVDDGSTDGSFEKLKELSIADKRLKVISFRGNYGQTAAISAGIRYSSGEVIIPIDADLENDPRDIPRLLAKIDEGYDVVSGWRQRRWQENFFTRKIPSVVANWIISKITKVKLHDYGCTLKAYRREVIQDVHLYGEMHRFIPVYVVMCGAKSAEVVINYQPRKHGHSHYNWNRVFKVILDLLTITFLSKYFTRPMHFFGKMGLYLLFFGLISGGSAVYLKIFENVSLIVTPLPLLTGLFFIIGFQFILMGLLAEVIIRTYFESQQKPIFLIKEKVNFD